MLWAENVGSVSYRYSGDNDPLPGPIDFATEDAITYVWTRPAYRMTAVEALKAIMCYEYQSCEHPAWPSTEAYRFCQALTGSLLHALPGMDDAPWSWTDEHVAEAHRSQMVGG